MIHPWDAEEGGSLRSWGENNFPRRSNSAPKKKLIILANHEAESNVYIYNKKNEMKIIVQRTSARLGVADPIRYCQENA